MQKRKIIMLPTRQASIVQMHRKNLDFQPLTNWDRPYVHTPAVFHNQHVFILSNDEIKEFDYYVNIIDLDQRNNPHFVEVVLKRASSYDATTIKERGFTSCKKIIATTADLKCGDKKVPRIEVSSLRKYLDFHETTKEVIIDIEDYFSDKAETLLEDRWRYKISNDNTIGFELIHAEKIYTKDQIADIIYDFIHSHKDIMMNGGGYNNVLSIKEWINEKGL